MCLLSYDYVCQRPLGMDLCAFGMLQETFFGTLSNLISSPVTLLLTYIFVVAVVNFYKNCDDD